MSVEKLSTEATLSIPFQSHKHAEIAYRVLSVDQEPRRNFVQKALSLEADVVKVVFKADNVKNLRTAITSFFENLLLCQETIKTFDVAAVSKVASEDARAHTSADTA